MLLSALLLPLVGCTDPAADASATADTAGLGGGDGRSPGHYFPDAAPWTTPVTDAPTDPDSDSLIAALQQRNWGMDRFQMDFSLEILGADADTPRQSFTPTADFYSPDCDNVPMPVPDDGNVEGETGYACEGGGDCHLLVAAEDEAKLYEMFRADIRGSQFNGGCLAVWDMNTVYPASGRGDQCGSADAAGYPIAPLLFTADEVASGEIDHALRFALPNDRIRDGEFFHPASHATNAEGGGADAIPYGAHLRLKPEFDESRIADPDALVVVHALQTYGMFLADGGNIALMGESDQRASAKWDTLFQDGSHALFGIEPQDFELLALDGPAIPLTFECNRN